MTRRALQPEIRTFAETSSGPTGPDRTIWSTLDAEPGYLVHARRRTGPPALLTVDRDPRARGTVAAIVTSSAGHAAFVAAYEATLARWPIPYMRYAATDNPARPDEHTAVLNDLAEQMFCGFKHLGGLWFARPTVLSDRELRGITCPVLLLVGKQEKIYRPEAVIERAEALIPDLRAELIDDASHDLVIAQPDIVNRRLVEFLAA